MTERQFNRIDGTEGPDELLGAAGDDLIIGYDGSDQLAGDAGNDVLVGSGDSDHIIDGAGNDILVGGAEADFFEFAAGVFGTNVILDYDPAMDVLFFAAADPDQLEIEEYTNGTLITAENEATETFGSVLLAGVSAGELGPPFFDFDIDFFG